MRFRSVRNQIRRYRFLRHCDSVLQQARHQDFYINRSLQFGSNRAYWILVIAGLASMVIAQFFK